MTPAELNLVDRVYIIACGTSYHAGLIAKNLIESWARIPCEVEVASEFRYRNPIITPTTLVVAVSQSGETADTLAAIRDARVKGAKVFGITNVVGSPVARESDGVIYTKANKEIAVASTKSFLGQVVSLTLLAMLLGQAVGRLTGRQIKLLFSELADTAEQVERILADCDPAVEAAADAMVDATSAYSSAGAWGPPPATRRPGMKEISYLHAGDTRRRRDETPAHRPLSLRIPRGGHRDEEPRLRQGGVEFAGSEARGAPSSSYRGRRGNRQARQPRHLHSEKLLRRLLAHHGQRALAAALARRGRQTRLRRGAASQSREIGDGRIASSLFRRRARPQGAFASDDRKSGWSGPIRESQAPLMARLPWTCQQWSAGVNIVKSRACC